MVTNNVILNRISFVHDEFFFLLLIFVVFMVYALAGKTWLLRHQFSCG